MATTAKTLAIDLEKALRLQNVVESGNFSITKRPPKGDPLRKRQAFIQDLKRSINGDGELRQLLLNKDHVRQLAFLPHTKALMVQHRAVWGQRAARWLQTSSELQNRVLESIRVIYALRKEENTLIKAKDNDDVDEGMVEELQDVPPPQPPTGDNKIDSALLNLAQIQVDFEDCETELVQQVNNCFLGVRPNRQHEIVDSIETQLDSLKLEEEGLMRSLFWLHQQSSSSNTSKMMFDPTTALKTIKSVEDDGSAETLQNFPICTALSPSAKSLKIPASAYSSHTCLVQNNGLCKRPSLEYASTAAGTMSKRLSLDSGYAGSSNEETGSNIGLRMASIEDDDDNHIHARDPCHPTILADSSNESNENAVEVLKKQELEKMCDKCHRKMSVKFDFNKMETEGDPEAWVVFNCSMCATPECQYEDDSGDETNDMIESQLTGILQDVTVYYTKKLDMYRIKMEHHQRTRPDRAHYELASILIESYEDHPNRDELWKDMFCRLVEDEAMPYHATAIQRWMQEELQIKAAMRACIQDLRRERDKISNGMDKLRAKAKESRAKIKAHQSKLKDQLEQCQHLHASLKVLQLSKQERRRIEIKAKEEQRLFKDRIKNERRQKFRERQKEQWAQIRSYRRNREEIKAEQRFHLHQELKASVRARRERALQDFIRVNLRRVMAEQKTLERKAYFAAKEEAEREQDARLETLRKATRRKLGLGSSQNAGKHTAFLPTVASASKIREKKATNIEDRLVGADEGAHNHREIASEGQTQQQESRPMWKLYTFREEDILADPRLVVEQVLREQGLLQGSKYAVDQIMREFKAPRRPRPDTKSQLDSIFFNGPILE